jgi:hypothetical protein
MTAPARVPRKSPPLAEELLGRQLCVSYDPGIGMRSPLATVSGVLAGIGYFGREAFLRLRLDEGDEMLVRSWCVVSVLVDAPRAPLARVNVESLL